MLNPHLLVFDLDGTLAESKQRMSAQMGDLLAELLQKMPVAIMSGGGWAEFEKQFFSVVPPDTNLDKLYIFPQNASQCFVHKNGTWHPQYDNAFTPIERDHILQALEEALEETGLTQPPASVWGNRIEDRGAEITFSGLGQEAPTEQKQAWDPDGTKKRTLQEALIKRLPEFAIGTNSSTSVDITRKGITKAHGIKRLTEMTGIPIERMLYIGDALDEGGNDASVIDTGVPTHAVFAPRETEALIETVLHAHKRN